MCVRFSADREELLTSAHLVSAKKDRDVTLVAECPICLCPLEGACSMRRLPCGHMFCLDCCVDHIRSKLAMGVSTGMGIVVCS